MALDETGSSTAQSLPMFLVLIALVLLVYVIWRGQEKPVLTRGDWRTGSGLLAIGSFMAAAFLTVRAQWPEAAAMLAIACALLLGARSQRSVPSSGPPPQPPSDRMSRSQARAILGVDEGATPEQIRAAYARLIVRAHPDHGGSHGLAAQLNAARDLLLGRGG